MIGAPLLPAERARAHRRLEPARGALGEQSYGELYAAGRSMSTEQAIAVALEAAEALAPDTNVSPRHVTRREPLNGSRAATLTRRGREVATLIGQGMTNRQIAAELVVSERTVEAHVTGILDRLGLSSRAQIAVWAAQHGLLDSDSAEKTAPPIRAIPSIRGPSQRLRFLRRSSRTARIW